MGLASIGWNSERLPGNEYRQTHTAITAYFIQKERNFSLDYPTPLLGKPWSVPYEFPLYQWSVVGVSEVSGWPLVQSARAVTLLCFYLMLPAFAWLVNRFTGSTETSRLALIFVLMSPLYIFYSRAFLIDLMALAAVLWYARNLVECLERPSWRWFVAANLFGLVAGLVKIMTLLLFSIPMGVYLVVVLMRAWRDSGTRQAVKVLSRWAATAFVPIVLSYAWIQFADSVKFENPSSALLTSNAMNGYHFGSWGDRVDPEFWSVVWRTITTNMMPGVLFGTLVVWSLYQLARRRWHAGAMLGMFMAGPLVYPHLYAIHEYYFTAVGVFLAVVAAMAVRAFRRWNGWSVVLAASLVIALQGWAYHRFLYPHQRDVLADDTGLPGFLKATTDPDEVLIIVGDDWAPMVPYGARRRALMFRTFSERDPVMVDSLLNGLNDERVGAFVMKGSDEHYDVLKDEVVHRFGLLEKPVASVDDYQVWADSEHWSRMTRATRELFFAGVKLSYWSMQEFFAIESPKRSISEVVPDVRAWFTEQAPGAREIQSDFPVTVITLPTETVVGAHPNQHVWLEAPAGTVRLDVSFGILPQAYDPNATEALTDGVGFSARCEAADGATRIVWLRYLNPTSVEGDRGTIHAQVEFELLPGERVCLSTDAGPNGALNRDWAYWAGMQIKVP